MKNKTMFELWLLSMERAGWRLYPLEVIKDKDRDKECILAKMKRSIGDGIPCYDIDVLYILWWEGKYIWAGRDYLTAYKMWEGRINEEKPLQD